MTRTMATSPRAQQKARRIDSEFGHLGERAVVLGASMGGLLAARVLADFFRTVTVIERDELPDDPVNRRGVPQGRHVHALLARGAQIISGWSRPRSGTGRPTVRAQARTSAVLGCGAAAA
jgi:pimeloyl-ACP methyl ester carboxylesterase